MHRKYIYVGGVKKMRGIANRMNRLGTENAFVVLAKVKRMIAAGADIVSFGIGEPDFDTPKNIKIAGMKAIDDNETHYGPSAGLPAFRETIAKYISDTRKTNVHADNVVVVPGGKPVLFFTMQMLVNEGDEVLYPTPGYPIYESMAEFCGANAKPYEILENKGFSFDIKELEKQVSEKTKLLVLNSPANPTGGVVPKEDLEKLADLAKKYDFYILSDEIYSKIVYDDKFESILQFPDMLERTIVLDGHSKTYAMTGWRLGYGVMSKELAEHMTRLMINGNSCTATFTQIAGMEAYKGPQDEAEAMVAEFKARRDLIVRLLNDIPGISCHKPKGAFYVFPNVTEICKEQGFADANHLADYLLEVGHVAVLGRTNFGRKLDSEENEYIRLSYATNQTAIKEGIHRIKKTLANKEAIEKFLADETQQDA